MKGKRFLVVVVVGLMMVISGGFVQAGQIIGWGDTQYGQGLVPAGDNFTAVSTGPYHCLAINENGQVFAWGNNDFGQCDVPALPEGVTYTAVAGGSMHSLALKSDGTIAAWGFDDPDIGICNVPPLSEGVTYTAIATEGDFSLALRSDGQIAAWGYDIFGEIADVPTAGPYVKIAAGQATGYAIDSNGKIAAWGDNTYGQVAQVAALNVGNTFIDIAGGVWHAVAIKSDGSLVTWGSTAGNLAPPAGNDYVAVEAGEVHCLALRANGSLVAWGATLLPQVYNTPTGVFSAISATGAFNLALTGETNRPPVADAGDSTQILSTDQSVTVLYGTASDPDGDSLEYRWMEASNVLLDWTPVGTDGSACLNLGTVSNLSIGNHLFTLEVRDMALTASDTMVLTIDNSPPDIQPSPSHQVVEIGVDQIIVVADVADFDGDTLHWQWLKDSEVLALGNIATVAGGQLVPLPPLVIEPGDSRFPLGLHIVELYVYDGTNQPVSKTVTVEVVDTIVPSLSPVPSITMLWPPNHQLVPVTIWANAYDKNGGPIVLSVSVVSSEPQRYPCWNIFPDYYIDSVDNTTGVIQLRLRAERSGRGIGRTYTITITATDQADHASTAQVQIYVPHDRRKK